MILICIKVLDKAGYNHSYPCCFQLMPQFTASAISAWSAATRTRGAGTWVAARPSTTARTSRAWLTRQDSSRKKHLWYRTNFLVSFSMPKF